MFIKTLKHDFRFSRMEFLLMGGGLVGFAGILWLSSLFTSSASGDSVLSFTGAMSVASLVVLIVVVLSAAFQIQNFFSQSFFGDAGYLMLTLPTPRGKQLLSKIIVSMVWFNFLLVAGFTALFLINHAIEGSNPLAGFFELYVFFIWVEINIFVFAILAAMFFAITLANSIIGSYKIPGAVAGLATAGLSAFIIRFAIMIHARQREFIQVFEEHNIYDEMGNIVGTHGFGYMRVQVERGMREGRIPIGETAFFDIILWGMVLGVAVLAFLAVYYMLKRRVCLS